MYVLGVKVQNMKMDFKIGGTTCHQFTGQLNKIINSTLVFTRDKGNREMRRWKKSHILDDRKFQQLTGVFYPRGCVIFSVASSIPSYFLWYSLFIAQPYTNFFQHFKIQFQMLDFNT